MICIYDTRNRSVPNLKLRTCRLQQDLLPSRFLQLSPNQSHARRRTGDEEDDETGTGGRPRGAGNGLRLSHRFTALLPGSLRKSLRDGGGSSGRNLRRFFGRNETRCKRRIRSVNRVVHLHRAITGTSVTVGSVPVITLLCGIERSVAATGGSGHSGLGICARIVADGRCRGENRRCNRRLIHLYGSRRNVGWIERNSRSRAIDGIPDVAGTAACVIRRRIRDDRNGGRCGDGCL